MLKSGYLICYNKHVSEKLSSIQMKNDMDVVELANREEIKRVISINNCSIEKRRINNTSYPMEILLFPQKEKPLCMMMKSIDEGELWYCILMMSHFSVQKSDFQILGELGRGAFGKVDLAKYSKDGKLYALKTVCLSENGHSYIKQLVEERTIMQKMRECPFIVRLEMAYYEEMNLHYVLEYCERGDLHSYMAVKGPLNENEIRMIGGCIVSAIGYMHSHNLLHRDIKPENIMLKANGVAKLADFGLSKTLTSMTSRAFSFCGTDLYRPPEMSKHSIGYNRSLDWWQVGCILYEMAVGRHPFEGTREERRDRVLREEPIYPDTISPELKTLLQGLLMKNALNRLGGGLKDAEEVKQSAFFKTLDWNKLEQTASSQSSVETGIPSPIRPEVAFSEEDRSFDRSNLLGFEYDNSVLAAIINQIQKLQKRISVSLFLK